jgi:hypothetical protein
MKEIEGRGGIKFYSCCLLTIIKLQGIKSDTGETEDCIRVQNVIEHFVIHL